MSFKKILIVDDELEMLEIVRKKLFLDGYQVLAATRGEEAVEVAMWDTPDLILLDIVLPDLDGPEVVKLLNENPVTADIPVIFLSGIVSRDEETKSCEIKVGGQHYPAIGKPFTYKELLIMIKEILGE